MQTPTNNEPRQKFTGSYKKACIFLNTFLDLSITNREAPVQVNLSINVVMQTLILH